jgi:hypothetical protein
VRPYLDPSLPLLWRAPDVLQIGLDPAHACALDGAPPLTPSLLRRLDGREPLELLHDDLRGSPHARVFADSVTLLEQQGVLRHRDPADVWAEAWVEVAGDGRLARAVTTRLRPHLGRCHLLDEPSELRPDLVVVAADRGRGLPAAEPLMNRGTPHLWVTMRDGRALVGPLVEPGRTSCLRCHDLHRTDCDPAWPRLAVAWEQDAPSPAPSAAVGLAGALAARQALAWLAGARPATLDGTLEEQPDGTVLARPWARHVRCGCAWSALAAVLPAPAVPAPRGGGREPARGRRPDAPHHARHDAGPAAARSPIVAAGQGDRP